MILAVFALLLLLSMKKDVTIVAKKGPSDFDAVNGNCYIFSSHPFLFKSVGSMGSRTLFTMKFSDFSWVTLRFIGGFSPFLFHYMLQPFLCTPIMFLNVI